MRPKFNWEKVQMESLTARHGAETAVVESNRAKVVEIRCRLCEEKLRNSTRRAYEEHIGICSGFDFVARDNSDPAHPIIEYVGSSRFPACLLGKKLKIRTQNFVGRVREVLKDPPTIKVEAVDGTTKNFDVEKLVRAERNHTATRKRQKKIRKQPRIPLK